MVRPRYPTLSFIERSQNVSTASLTACVNAAALEGLARDLVVRYWSDTAWTTGVVPRAAFDRVVTELTANAVLATTPLAVATEVVIGGQDAIVTAA